MTHECSVWSQKFATRGRPLRMRMESALRRFADALTVGGGVVATQDAACRELIAFTKEAASEDVDAVARAQCAGSSAQ